MKATVSLSDQQAFRHEVFALRQLSHPNVVRFIDVVHYQTVEITVSLERSITPDSRTLLRTIGQLPGGMVSGQPLSSSCLFDYKDPGNVEPEVYFCRENNHFICQVMGP